MTASCFPTGNQVQAQAHKIHSEYLRAAWEESLTGDECSMSLRARTTLGERSGSRGQGVALQGITSGGNSYSIVNQVPKEEALTWNSQLRRDLLPSYEGGETPLMFPRRPCPCVIVEREMRNHQTSPGLKLWWLPLLERTERSGFKQ